MRSFEYTRRREILRLTYSSFRICRNATRRKAFWAPAAHSLNKNVQVMSLAV